MSQNHVQTAYHPRWLRPHVSTYWWMEKPAYLVFILREGSCMFVAWFTAYLLFLLRAMQQGEAIADWRLLVHRDTAYRHAHVLFFRDRRLEKGEFLAWQHQVREALLQLEKQHTAEQQLQYEADTGKARGLEVG